MRAVGLDIGTTTICAVVLDEESGELLQSITRPNDTALAGKPYERLQNPAAILACCETILADITARFAPVSCIGITGQMHGITYLNREGVSVSPLYTWQDESANELGEGAVSYAQRLSGLTAYPMASGFGAASYYTHHTLRRVPEDAVSFCTIHDYVAMRLCGRKTPLVHASDAASFGLFQNMTMRFDEKAIRQAGLDSAFFPEVTADFALAGSYQSIPVTVAIGDNQASFLGSVSDMNETLLVNVGTGSQISFATANTAPFAQTELRPCVDGLFLRVGCSLCGGRAFAALEQFLRKTAEFSCGRPFESAYPAIDSYLAQSERPANCMRVTTTFSGTRANPQERGKIENLGLENFTPQHLIWGILQGIVSELALLYPAGENHRILVGSGNGLRKNEALRRLFSAQFGKDLKMPRHTEEAAVGAALFGMTAAKRVASIDEAQQLIAYL